MDSSLPFPSEYPPRRIATGLLPLTLFSLGAIAAPNLPAWTRMWLIAIALFAGFKWWTWHRAVTAGVRSSAARSFAYLFLWPGMGTRKFLVPNPADHYVTPGAWLGAMMKTVLGAAVLWFVPRHFGHGLVAGWIGMVGFIFMLHFGLFALLSFFWQGRGIDAPPLMKCPVAARSLQDFWGRRWNSGFHDIVSGLFFLPLARRFGGTAGVILTFVISGFLHELVITVPAGGGYGLPTLYFTLQGAAMMFERSRLGAAWGLAHGWRGRAFALAVVTLPIGALFPPVFVTHVMVPFFRVIQALP